MARLTEKKEQEIKERLKELSEAKSEIYIQVKNDLSFVSGEQWDTEVINGRGKSRPANVINLTKKYIKRIVNPTKKTPYKVDVSIPAMKDEDVKIRIDKPFQDVLDASINSDEGREAIDTAFYTAVSSGYGFLIPFTEYKNKNGSEQRINLLKVIDPTTVYLDPNSIRDDGSDANFAAVINYIDEKAAKAQYGDDIEIVDWQNSIYSYWPQQENTVPEMIYYCREASSKEKYFMNDGSEKEYDTEDEYENISEDDYHAKRTIENYVIKIYKYVGAKCVEKTTLPIDYIPVVPVYGETKYKKDLICHNGLVDILRDPQKIVNYYSSAESELVASAPKAQWLMAKGQDDNFQKMWATCNTKPHARLIYNPVVGEDKLPVAPPQRIDNSAQTQSLIASRIQAQADMGAVTGMPDVAFGGMDSGSESGKSVLLRESAAEIPNADYQDYLEKSLLHCSKVICQMFVAINTENHQIDVETPNGKATKEIDLDDFDTEILEFDVDQGPRNESARKQSIATMLELGNRMPQQFPLIADLLVESLDAPGSKKIAERLRKTLPPELLDDTNEQIPPQAKQALDAAQGTINEQSNLIGEYEMQMESMKQLINQINTINIDNQKDRDTQITVAQIKSRTDLAKAQLDAQVTIQKAEIDAETKSESDAAKINQEIIKQKGESNRQQEEIIADAEKDIIGMADKAFDTVNNLVGDLPEPSLRRKVPNVPKSDIEGTIIIEKEIDTE